MSASADKPLLPFVGGVDLVGLGPCMGQAPATLLSDVELPAHAGINADKADSVICAGDATGWARCPEPDGRRILLAASLLLRSPLGCRRRFNT